MLVYLFGLLQLHLIQTRQQVLTCATRLLRGNFSVSADPTTRLQPKNTEGIDAHLALAPRLDVLEAHSAQERLDELTAGDAVPGV